MIKMLIADDEPFIRQGICTTIPWKEHGIEIVGEASNGKNALKLAMQLQPDIVIADISMPIMTGLELASKLNEYLPEVKIILLTAYGTTDNFTEAFKFKVSRFVLKSADASLILSNVLQVKEEIEKEHKLNRSYEQLNTIYNENQHLIKSTLICRLLNSQLAPSSFEEKAAKVGLPLTGPLYTMLLAKCRTQNSWLTISAFQKAFDGYEPIAFFAEKELLLVILNTRDSGISETMLADALPEIKPYLVGNQLTCLNEIRDFEEFPISYQTLKNRLNDCFWNREWEYSVITQKYLFLPRNKDQLLNYEKEIITSVLCQNPLLAEQGILRYYQYCKENSMSQNDFLDSVKRLLLLITAAVPSDTDINELISQVCELETPEEMTEALKSLILSPGSPDSQNPQIAAALNYINENYEKDLRLEDVSRQVYLSVGYLSRIFKTETGYSFKEWLHRVRIEKAKELIAHTDLKYYEIAEKVGYKDYKYFSAYFNKLCGCSAKEYKSKAHLIP